MSYETQFLNVINELITYYNNPTGTMTLDTEMVEGCKQITATVIIVPHAGTEVHFVAQTTLNKKANGIFGDMPLISLTVEVYTIRRRADDTEDRSGRERGDYGFFLTELDKYRRAVWQLFKPSGAFNTHDLKL